MKLPAEIRLEILRELLWQPEPLKKKKFGDRTLYQAVARVKATNYTFHPAILATCRKLNEEGCTVLYEENTVDVTFSCYALHHNQYRIDWMNYAVDLEMVSKSLSQRARKLRITVRAHRLPANIVRSGLRNLVKILQANPQWCSLDIHLEREELGEEILRPFGILRRLRHVDVTGVSPQFAAELSELMKGDSPVTDLPEMYYCLTRYTRTVLSQHSRGANSFDLLFPAEQAMNTGNATDFYKCRDKVLWEMEKIAREDYRRVFQSDSNPLASRLSSNTFIAEQERLESLVGNPA